MEELTIKILVKYLNPKLSRLEFVGGEKSNWIDLRSSVDISLKSGEFALIPLGVAIKLPEMHEALVAPRSSTFKNFGIIQTNSIGVIDQSYCGDNDEWFFPALAMRDTEIHMNDRICQFRIIESQPRVQLLEVGELNSPDRGGAGSTGVE